MNNIWYRLILLSFLLMLVLAPFAGFAPLLLVILIAGVYWFLAPLAKIIVFGETKEKKEEQTQ